MWFYTLLHNYSLNLFKIYHYAFVKKTFNKPDIPYDLKPLCGDLHKIYKSNNTPITNTIIEQYLFDLHVSKLYWRLFKNTVEITSITKNIEELSLSNTTTNPKTHSSIQTSIEVENISSDMDVD